MKLNFATACAAKLTAWLAPICERVEVAGSIRRGRTVIGDVDLVIQPRVRVVRNLLGDHDGAVNDTAVEILARANRDGWKVLQAGEQVIQILSGRVAQVQVDFYFATPDSWASVLLCRTGSREHNVWIASEATRRGLHWNPSRGLMRGEEQLPTSSEREIYERLGLTYLEPSQREQHIVTS